MKNHFSDKSILFDVGSLLDLLDNVLVVFPHGKCHPFLGFPKCKLIRKLLACSKLPCQDAKTRSCNLTQR